MGCREHKNKTELIRIVRSPEGVIAYDPIGKRSGRGVYLCRNPKCLERVRKSKAMEKQLKAVIPPEIYEEIALLMSQPNG
jgi:predicted RNA-binding protein YlxR (DUF448 family)